MARPIKNNMDYFPHDNKMRNDRKIKALRAKYGLEGYAVYNMLLEILCEAELLIIQWDEAEIELISGDLTIVSDKLTEITEYLCKIKLLNKVNGWLFCEKLDSRSEAVFGKRTRDLDGLRNENGINVTEIGVSDTEGTQSKVKQSKAKHYTWRDDFEFYKKQLRESFVEIMNDNEWITKQERLNPGVDVKLSMEKACTNFWSTEAGWKKKKSKRDTENIDWKATMANAITLSSNKVYKPRNEY